MYGATESGDTEVLVAELQRWVFKCRLKVKRLWYERTSAGRVPEGSVSQFGLCRDGQQRSAR